MLISWSGGIFYWIFAALSNLMETLEAQQQSAKLGLFQKLWWVLVLAIAFAFAVLLAPDLVEMRKNMQAFLV